MKNRYLLFLALCASTSLHGMNNSMVAFPLFTKLPADIQLTIFQHTLPDTHNWQEDLRAITSTIYDLQLVYKQNLNAFSTMQVAPLLNITNANRDLLLFRAAQIGATGLIQLAIDRKADLNFVYTTQDRKDLLHGCTPLSIAVRYNNYRSCSQLLHAGANVHKTEEDRAADTGRCEKMTYPNNFTPIDLATIEGNTKIMQLLIDHKATIDKDTLGNAIRYQHAAAAKMLLDNKPAIVESILSCYKKALSELLATLETEQEKTLI